MNTVCKKCGKVTEHTINNIKWDEKGYGYSTKICVCKHCGFLNIVEIIEDYGFDMNKDRRYYS